jgi:hypothetical protein
MELTKSERDKLRNDLKRGSRRSPLFWWFVKHADDFLADGNEPVCWTTQCARLAEHQVTDHNGKAPSIRTAKQTWQRVKMYIAKQPAKAPLAGQQPQHSPRTNEWRPPVAEPKSDLRNFTTETQLRARQAAILFREAPMPSRVGRPASAEKKIATDDDLTPEQQAKIDRIKAEFREAACKRAGNFY